MKSFAVIGLAAAATVLFLDLAQGLECYFCPSPTPALQCTTKQNCTDQQSWCSTTVYGPGGYPFQNNRLVVRGCAEHCDASNPNNLGVTRPTLCCQEDLCNILSKAPGTKVTIWETSVIGSTAAVLLLAWR